MNLIDSSTARTSAERPQRELPRFSRMNSIDLSAARTSADRQTHELRRFGLLMAAAFATLGSLSLWRGKFLGPYLLALAAAFLLAGLVLPRLLAPAEKAWMRLATLISVVMTYVILNILFFAVITPLGMVMRLCGHDPLKLKKAPAPLSFWESVDPEGPCGRPTKPF